MSILSWIVLGLVAGWLASFATGHEEGCLTDVLLGIVGAMIGGAIFTWFGGAPVRHFNLHALVVATVGAVILLVIRGIVAGRRFR
jgi:uncharacterized membrane protein YeaQ/YmgE (transglycosylase-associated protein family)